MTAAAVLAAACGVDSPAGTAVPPRPVTETSNGGRSVVEVVPVPSAPPPLDPDADPRTPLGELRAGYFPIWSPDFDWAFPPEACGSAWELDAIAEPTGAAGVGVLGDPVVAAALSVMRYEHLVSTAMARPDARRQLCVAVATVGDARADALEVLAALLGGADHAVDAPWYPGEVTVAAASPTSVLAVACSTPPGSPAAAAGGAPAGAGKRPAAYLLVAARGLEDTVTDVSFRVADVTTSPDAGCEGMDAWTDIWSRRATEWAEAGQIWAAIGTTVTAEEVCESQQARDEADCPKDWAR